MALDPTFPTNSSIYVLYTHDARSAGRRPPTTTPAPIRPARVRGERRLSPTRHDGSEQVLIEDWCQQYPCHSVGSLEFGPDGALYASAGDGASYNFVDYGQGGSPENPCGDPPGGVGRRSARRRRKAGRCDPGPEDPRRSHDPGRHRHPGRPGHRRRDARQPARQQQRSECATDRRVRSPQPVSRWRSGPGPTSCGSGTWDGTTGRRSTGCAPADGSVDNFGWPCYEGQGRQPGYDAPTSRCARTSTRSRTPSRRPTSRTSNGPEVVPNDACPIGGSSLTGLAFQFYRGGPYPPEYDGALFFADYSRGCIWVMKRSGGTLPSPSNVSRFVRGAATPVDLEIGPGGDLFYVDFGGTVRRISTRPRRTRDPPPGEGEPTSGDAPLTVNFDGTVSSDPDGDPLSYAWDLDGDGAYDDSGAPQRGHTTAPATTWPRSR